MTTKHKTLYSMFIAPQINEMREKGFFRSLQLKYPHVPNYVIREIYNTQDKSDSILDKYDHIEEVMSLIGSKQWKLEKIELHISKISEDTKHRFFERKFGAENPYKVPNDEARILQQLKNVGGSDNEPVIFFNQPDGLELIEGYHRTMTRLMSGSDNIIEAQKLLKNTRNNSLIEKIAMSWKPVTTKAWIGY